MTVPQAITSEIQKLEPSAIVELFELDATAIGGEVLRFHAGTNGLRQNVVWQGNTYTAFPMQATGFDYTGNGQLPRPKMIMSNASGAMTLLVLSFDDMLGTKVTRRRTLAKYLDAVNFPARRNLLERSASIGTTPIWTNEVFSGTLTQNYGIAPDGTTTTTYYNLAGGYAYQRKILSPNTTYTFSCFVRGAPASGKGIGIWSYAASGIIATSSQEISDTFFTRCTVTFTSSATGDHAMMVAGIPTNVFKTVEVWGAQLDLGSSATEYQPIGATWSQNPTADPAAEFPVDIFYIDRKASETKDVVEFELASSFDVAGVELPRRQIIQNVCTWRYRGTECGYTGTNYFNANDASVGTLAQDVCGKRLSSCKARFGTNNPLPFGSFPAAGLTR
jgi:phage-related protein